MSEKDKLYRNLVKLLKLFQNRPNHLAKYLIDNIAFNDVFIKMIIESERLSEIDNESQPFFKNVEEMEDFYNNVLNDEYKKSKKSPEKLIKELNKKLEECLKDEKYEDAIRIRDYLSKIKNK